MAISRKKDYARMIAMMVRRESVTFDPADRVRLDVSTTSKSGQTVNYDVGEIYYDFDSGRMCYRLFAGDGAPVTRPSGPFFLDEDLTSSELMRVSRTVSDYVEKSIGRGKNILLIEDLVYNSPEMSVDFKVRPKLAVDLGLDGNVEMYEPDKIYDVSAFWEDRRDIMLAGRTSDGKDFSFPLIAVSDMGLAVVRDRVLESVRALSRSRSADAGKDWRETLAHDLAMEITVGGDRFDRDDLRYFICENDGSAKDMDFIRSRALEMAFTMQPDGREPKTVEFFNKSLDYWLDPKFHAAKDVRDKKGLVQKL